MNTHPGDLQNASATLHQAAQYVAMAGRFFIPNKEDDSHTNMDWYASKNWLIGNAIKSPYGVIHVALDNSLLVLLVCNDKYEPIAEYELSGKTRLEGFNWLNNQLWKLGLEIDDFEPELHYVLEDHPVLHGAKFEMDRPKNFHELSSYRCNGHSVLKEVSDPYTDKSDLRIWPHHFDDGIIINLERDDESVVSLISMGLAMPDAHYDQPYFYVNPWHRSGVDHSKLPEIGGKGFWHTKDWHGMVLLAKDIAVNNDHDEQKRVTLDFLSKAIDIAKRILD
jgi:hypothetical protein